VVVVVVKRVLCQWWWRGVMMVVGTLAEFLIRSSKLTQRLKILFPLQQLHLGKYGLRLVKDQNSLVQVVDVQPEYTFILHYNLVMIDWLKAFSDSLIGYITKGSLKLPSILGQPTTTALKIEIELTKENVQAIIKLVNELAPGNSLKKVMGNMLIFTRKDAGYCPIWGYWVPAVKPNSLIVDDNKVGVVVDVVTLADSNYILQVTALFGLVRQVKD